MLDRRRARGERPHHTLERRAQLPGAQLHARPDAGRRRRALLPFSCPEPGIAGLAEVASTAYLDKTQFERKSPYYDAGSKKDAPRWFNVDVRALRKTRLISLIEIREQKPLAKMVTLRPGNRLSITPVTEAEWKHIQGLL